MEMIQHLKEQQREAEEIALAAAAQFENDNTPVERGEKAKAVSTAESWIIQERKTRGYRFTSHSQCHHH